ncbi:MAG: PDZ domain-containing protein [Akkermansiaceae bacterium]|nr:PDZ domain-containing protein [Akkermansiaceae bacterium]
MYKKLIALCLAGLVCASCEPTYRRPQKTQDKKAEAGAAATSTTTLEFKNAVKSELKPELLPELKNELQPALKNELKQVLSAELQPKLTADIKDLLKAELHPELKTGLKTELKNEIKSEMNAEAQAARSEAEAAAVAQAGNVEKLCSCLVTVALTTQDYNAIRPWEKQQASSSRINGVYVGEGKVLTLGSSLPHVNYVEIALPDGSRSVPARVLRYDTDLNLGLLEADAAEAADLFAGRSPLPLGDAMTHESEAELLCALNGTQPTAIPLQAELGTSDRGLPRLQMRAEQAVPGTYSHGAPVVADGKLTGISAGYNAASRQLKVINGELIRRFMEAKPDAAQGVPLMGVVFAELSDPVFRRYLKLADSNTGVYVSKVVPAGAAAAAGLQDGDVLTAVEGLSIDNKGRCNLPGYGLIDVTTVVRYLKPLGESLTMTFCRNGEEKQAVLQLNRDAEQKALVRTEEPAEAPRYIVWGGLVFQPLTRNYLGALQTQANGSLPNEFLKLDEQEDALRARGFRELTALTLVYPTQATIGYEQCQFCLVEKVNGVEPHDFAQFVSLLKAPTPTGLVEIAINKAPYRIYMDPAAVEASAATLRRSGIIQTERLTPQ